MSVLSGSLHAAVASRFPDARVSRAADFRPMAELARGDMSSSAAIEIARLTKRDARRVAAELLEVLGREFPAEWRSDAGYIVCRGVASEALRAEVINDVPQALHHMAASEGFGVACVGPEGRAVWCCLPDVTEPAYARVRLVARAALHALLMVVYEGRCRVTFGLEPLKTLSSIGEVTSAFRRAVLYILSHESEVRRDVRILFDSVRSESPVFIWTSHHFHDRLSSESRRTLADARADGRAVIKMPGDGWLLSRDRALSELLSAPSISSIASRLTTDDQWLRFLFHAASSVPSGDFDPAVALFDECASPLWTLRLLMDRFSRFGKFVPLPVAEEALPARLRALSGEGRDLCLRGVFLPLFTAQAILQGEVAEWAVAMEDFARLGHGFLNAPATRLALHRGDLSGEVGEIVASVGFGLSSILGVVAEGSCADQ